MKQWKWNFRCNTWFWLHFFLSLYKIISVYLRLICMPVIQIGLLGKPVYLDKIKHERQQIPIWTDGKGDLLAAQRSDSSFNSSATHWQTQSVFAVAACLRVCAHLCVRVRMRAGIYKTITTLSCLRHVSRRGIFILNSFRTYWGHFPRVYTTLREKGRVSGGSNCPQWGRQCLHECGLWVARDQ